ncbi:phosphatase PAP2 family protein [Herbaspirillum sp. HC18]|nr:phosphatase PAP2 family protein [Herbaspirillum sp. HC18]
MSNPAMSLSAMTVFYAALIFQAPALSQPADREAAISNPIVLTQADAREGSVPPSVDGVFSMQYGRLLEKDLVHIVTSPADWKQEEWRRAGIVAATVLGVGVLFDRTAYDKSIEMRAHETEQRAKQYERFGTPEYALLVLGGFYAAGLSGNENAMHVAQDGLASSLITSIVIVPTLKFVIGRARPGANEGALSFHPFTKQNASFPSGHTAQAFALSSAVAAHYDELWIKALMYGTASLTGIARVYHGAHFASDVVAGLAIGTWVGNSVVAYNDRLRSGKASFMPVISPQMTGMAVRIQF